MWGCDDDDDDDMTIIIIIIHLYKLDPYYSLTQSVNRHVVVPPDTGSKYPTVA